ncbi:MAG: type II toxin-antitoxin system ParD family antitoxin [Gemmatimonadaceae bacterium]
MQTMNVSLPESLKAFVDEQVSQGGYSSASEYVRELLRADQQRKRDDVLRQLLAEGLESGERVPASPAFWKSVQSDVARRVAEHKRQRGRK